MRLIDRTICLPKGSSDTGISLRLASASGIPTMVMACAMAVTMWPSTSHQPHNTSQMTLPTKAPGRGPGLSTTVWPNGHSAYTPMRAAATPNGMVTMRTKQIRAARK